MRLRFPHYFSFEAEPLTTLGEMLEVWECGDARILLPDPIHSCLLGRSYIALSNPPHEADLVTVFGDEAEKGIDEVVMQLMVSPTYYC